MWYDKASFWLVASCVVGILVGVGLWFLFRASSSEAEGVSCICKAEACPAVPACPDLPKPSECPVPLPATVCPEVECTEQVVTFGDLFTAMLQQAENQLRPLKAKFDAKKAELDPIFARAKELNIGPRQAWVVNPEAVQVYITMISRIGELETIYSQMLEIIQKAESRMNAAWYESVERKKLWDVLPRSVEPYRDQLRAFTGQADDQWFTYLCAWDYEKRNREATQ